MAKFLQDVARFKVELDGAQATEKMILLLEQLKKMNPQEADTYWLLAAVWLHGFSEKMLSGKL